MSTNAQFIVGAILGLIGSAALWFSGYSVGLSVGRLRAGREQRRQRREATPDHH